jgi:hypothetical protein
MGKFSPKEKNRLFYEGIIDHRGNIRLDRINDALRISKEKSQEIQKAYERLIIAKGSQNLLGIKIGECHIIGIFGGKIYLKCVNDDIKETDYSFVVSYIKNTRYVERV